MAINPHRSRLSFTIAGFIVLIASVFIGGWRANNYLRDIRDEMSGMRRELQGIRSEQWTVRNQERWAIHLERANAKLGLVVPDPSGIVGKDSGTKATP